MNDLDRKRNKNTEKKDFQISPISSPLKAVVLRVEKLPEVGPLGIPKLS